jgi:hypothetical protein
MNTSSAWSVQQCRPRTHLGDFRLFRALDCASPRRVDGDDVATAIASGECAVGVAVAAHVFWKAQVDLDGGLVP